MKAMTMRSLALASVLLVAGCGQTGSASHDQSTEGDTRATVSELDAGTKAPADAGERPENAPAPLGPVPGGIMNVPRDAIMDAGGQLNPNSIVLAAGRITTESNAHFETITGRLTRADGEPTSFAFSCESGSAVAVTDPELTGYARSPELLDAPRFPQIAFTSTKIAPTGRRNVYAVTGDLELRGTKKAITFEAAILTGGTQFNTKAEIAVPGADYGLPAVGPVSFTLDLYFPFPH